MKRWERGRKAHSVREVRRTFRMALWLAGISAAPFILLLLNAEAILRFAGQNPHVAERTGHFMHILVFALIPSRATTAVTVSLRSAGSAMLKPIAWPSDHTPTARRTTLFAASAVRIDIIEPAIAVDTHVFRVAHRLKMSDGKTPDQVEADLMRVTPTAYLVEAHHWLILHGRYTCLARRPLCEKCLINDLCRWPEKTI